MSTRWNHAGLDEAVQRDWWLTATEDPEVNTVLAIVAARLDSEDTRLVHAAELSLMIAQACDDLDGMLLATREARR